MFIKKTIFAIIEYVINEDKQLINNNSIQNNIIKHFKKSHFLVKIFVYFSIYIINLYSILFHLKLVYKLSKDKQKKIFSKLRKLKQIKQDVIVELFHALLVLHNEISEDPLEKKINKQNLSSGNYFDNIVVGSGPGASVTAYNLQKQKLSTLVIEKGNFFEIFKYKHPGNEFIHKWKHGGIAGTIGNAQIKYAAAECFGGGSEINSGLFHGANEKFIKEMKKKFNIKNFNYNDLKRNIKKNKKLANISYTNIKTDTIANIMIDTAKYKRFNYEILPRYLSFKNNVIKKSTMTKTLLKKYILMKGKVSLNSLVTKIEKKNKLWVLKVIKKKKIYYLNCKNLFLCAGAPNTLFLLKKNNLINKKIPKYYFHLHPMIKIIVKFPKKINSDKYDICPVQINHFFPKFIIGHATSTKAQLKINSFTNPKVYYDAQNNWEYMAIFHVTFSLGYGKLIRIPKINDPIINYKLNNKDLLNLKDGLKKLCQFMFSSNCKYIFPVIANSQIIKGKKFSFIDKIKNVKDFNLTTVHLLGGCPMGEDKEKTIANSFGKINGQENLYVNDGSLICGKLLNNPQGIIMAMVLRNIEHFIKNNAK